MDCLVPCVRGRILSVEKSLVRASAAVERQQIWSHALFLLLRPPQDPGARVSPRGPRSCFVHPFRAQGQGCPMSLPRPPSPQTCTGPPTLSGGQPARSPASTFLPRAGREPREPTVLTSGEAGPHLPKPGSLKQTPPFPHSRPSQGTCPHCLKLCQVLEHSGHLTDTAGQRWEGLRVQATVGMRKLGPGRGWPVPHSLVEPGRQPWPSLAHCSSIPRTRKALGLPLPPPLFQWLPPWG